VSDLRLMFWLRWRQLRDSIVYGLRLLGYERGERIYALYLVGILAFWVLSMASFSFDLMINIGRNIHPRDLSAFLTLIPPVVLVGQVYVLVSALQTTPLKLTFPDMSYVASSPVQAVAMVLPGFTRQVILRLLLIVPLVMLLSALIARATGLDSTPVESVMVSFRAVVPTVLIVVITWAAAWLFGILRLIYPAFGRSSILWAVPIVLVPLALVVPNAVLFAGQTVIVAALGELPSWVLVFLLAVTVLLMFGLIRFSRLINVTHAVDESQLYARIQALGLLAWRQVDVQMRIRVQSRQAGRRAWLRLPTGVSERQAIAIRAALTYVRHPMMLITTLLWGGAMTLAALMVIRAGLPIPLLVGWVLVAGFAPPVGLLYVYRADTEEKFLRQFLLVDGFILLMADSIVPLMALVLGGVLVMVMQNLPSETILAGLLFVFIVAMVQLLCGAYGVTKGDRALQTRLIAIVVSYIVIAIGFSLASFTGALIGGFLVVTTLMGLISEA
jgi:hypothetical protein